MSERANCRTMRIVGGAETARRRKACDTHVLQALTNLAFTTAFSVSGAWAEGFLRPQ